RRGRGRRRRPEQTVGTWELSLLRAAPAPDPPAAERCAARRTQCQAGADASSAPCRFTTPARGRERFGAPCRRAAALGPVSACRGAEPGGIVRSIGEPSRHAPAGGGLRGASWLRDETAGRRRGTAGAFAALAKGDER